MAKKASSAEHKIAPDDPAIDLGTSGLHELQRRSLARLVFFATGVLLIPYAVFEFSAHHWFLSILELASGIGLIFGSYRLGRSGSLQRWIYTYLVAVFSFFVYIVVMPERSETSFVWVFMMPVLSYLLLGRVAGFLLTAPFMITAGAAYAFRSGAITTPVDLINLLNPMVCGVALLVFIHVYELRRSKAHQNLVRLAETDALTGLANRSNFQATLDRTINECRRSETTFALVLADLDHFKRINDSLGHDAGDQVLRHFCQCVAERLRATDSFGRLGGEEFGLLLRDIKSGEAGHPVNELRERVQESEMVYGSSTIALTASFGIAYWPADALLANELYRIADRRLYASKHAGRNTLADRDPTGHGMPTGDPSGSAGKAI